MRLLIPVASALLVFLTAATANSQTPNQNIAVPRHTVVAVIIQKDIRVGGFGDAREEKKVEFEVAQDVIVDGYLIAKKGDLVEGHYTTQKNVTKRVFSSDVSQELALDVDDVVNFCGDTIHMQFERTFVGGGRASFMSLGAHAHDAVFAKGLVLKARTDRLEKAVCSEKTEEQPHALPSDILLSDEEATSPSAK
jgi:hypothetical protein